MTEITLPYYISPFPFVLLSFFLFFFSFYVKIEKTFKIELDFPGCSVRAVVPFFSAYANVGGRHEYALMSSKRIGIIRAEWGKRKKRARKILGWRVGRVTSSSVSFIKNFLPPSALSVGVAKRSGISS